MPPDRNLDVTLPRAIRVERTAATDPASFVATSDPEENANSDDSSESAVASPHKSDSPRSAIKRVVERSKSKKKKASRSKPATSTTKRGATSKKAGPSTAADQSDAEFDDATDEERGVRDRTPPSAQPVRRTELYIDLTGTSQNADQNEADEEAGPSTKASAPVPVKAKAKGRGKEKERKRNRKEQGPQEALGEHLSSLELSGGQDRVGFCARCCNSTGHGGIQDRDRTQKPPSDAYLYFKEPVIADHEVKGQGIGFWCIGCCAQSQVVWRPFHDSSKSNLRSNINSKASLSHRVNHPKDGPMDAFVVKKGSTSGPAQAHITAAEARQIALLPPEVLKMLPGRKTVSKDVTRIYHRMLDVIKERLAQVSGCFHLALDVWTSKNGNAFLAMIINYQKEGQAQRHLLDMIPFLASHDAKNMGKAVWQTIERAGIADRLWNLVADNASEKSAMLPVLTKLGGKHLQRFRGKASQVRCKAHICNLISKAVANTFVKAASSVRDKQIAKQVGINRNVQDEDEVWPSEGEEGVDADDDEERSTEDEQEAGANIDEGMMEEEEEEEIDVLDEPDAAISASLNPKLTAIDADDQEIDDILAGPVARARPIQTPTSSAEASSSGRAGASVSAKDAEERELRDGEVGLQIKKLAWLSKKLRYSPSARRVFKRKCHELKLPRPWTLLRDVATRWDSTQQMIERGLKLYPAVVAFSDAHPNIIPEKLRLGRVDKPTFQNLLEILTPLSKATARFSKKTKPMIGEVVGMFERLDSIFSAIEDNKTRPIAWRKAAERARKVVFKYYGLTEHSEVYVLAVLLHPNYRLDFLEAMKWEEDWKTDALTVLRQYYDQFYKIVPPESQDDADGSGADEEEEDDPVTLAMMKRSASRRIKRTTSRLSFTANTDSAVSAATSVDVERLFSRAGQNMTSLRRKMLARKLSKVVAVGQWFTDGWVPHDLLQIILGDEQQLIKDKREYRKRKRQADQSDQVDELEGNKRRKRYPAGSLQEMDEDN
ncbi:hypothetical protein V8E36_003198 [Tilletia maclaganii]